MQEAHEALYELHQDQQQIQAGLAASLAHQEQVSNFRPGAFYQSCVSDAAYITQTLQQQLTIQACSIGSTSCYHAGMDVHMQLT